MVPNLPILPIQEVIPEVKKLLGEQGTLILHAPPGAGKSTLLPLQLMDEPWLDNKKILMLEPRRLAASSIAYRMADLLGEQVGERVGYRIRFDTRISTKTKIEVITEGILTRMIQRDNALEDIGLVIFDEFHERSIHADLGLALCREIQQILRPELRILLMSATMETEALSRLLSAPVVSSLGKQFPVKVIYTGESDPYLIPEICSQATSKALQETQGDLLVFLPGQGEIKKTAESLTRKHPEVAVYQLYGQLPHVQQQAALLPDPGGKRKIVLATSIAETSLTIEGIQVVIDSGFTRSSRFDPKSGLSRLKTLPITKDAADQRAGRAGRLAPGTCYRLWSSGTHYNLLPFRTPEILETDLTPLVLELTKWGTHDFQSLTWLTPPPMRSIQQALETLEDIGAIDAGKITPHGEAIYELPCHPRIAHMLLKGKELLTPALATDLAAILEEKDPLDHAPSLDVSLRVEFLRRHRMDKKNRRAVDKIEKVAQVYRKLLQISTENDPVDPYAVGLLLAYAYPERIATSSPGNKFQLANGKLAAMDNKDDLAHQPWLAIAHMDAREKLGKIFSAAPLNPKDLTPMIKRRDKISWETKQGGLIMQEEWRIGQIILQRTPLKTPDKSTRLAVVLQAIKNEGQHLLNFNSEVINWQNRVNCLRRWNADQGWPDVSTKTLLQICEDWLILYLDRVKSVDDLKKINLIEVLENSLPYDLGQLLPQLAPENLEVPSGSKIGIQYQEIGPPILAVRLQELFGLMETPSINSGKMPLLIHLLSPGFKPVQVTTDLKSFWNNAYHEVKKEMKRRYPKHYWPDNPLVAEAVRGVKRKTNS
ncbi:MAG TPA: ATP-dependent helicase HrpB [Lunatimonas sp.]|nr:ATP-dependent helicase HrpB [Lunatimonas sp.]